MPTKIVQKVKKPIQAKPIIIANWKASTLSYKEAEEKIKNIYKELQKDINKIDLHIAPTISQIALLSQYFGGKIEFIKKTKKSKTKSRSKVKPEPLPKVTLTAQDISIFEGGSKTGEVPVLAAKDAGAVEVIIGHSECRERGDTLEMVVTKVKLALASNMNVVLCVGEKQRDSGVAYLKVIEEQITSVFSAVDKKDHGRITLAYEPVWAINNKDNISLDAHGLHSMVVSIKKMLLEKYGEATEKSIKILYGGSVNGQNAQDIFWNGEVQGLLIGRASFEPKTLVEVIKNILINPKKNILKTYGTRKELA
ncbi:MAG: triose-phosphate isomerase family protein [Patescibacteria group bacterium]